MKLPAINPDEEVQQITCFIQKTFKNSGKSTAIVAISGGIDSATALTLAAQSLNPENTLALHLPTKKTNPLHTQHTKQLANQLSLPEKNFITVNITSVIQKTWRIIKHYIKTSPPLTKERLREVEAINRLRLANLTARIRMMVLYDQAKKHDCLVVGTENLSEHLLGYYTRYGDEASDLEPIRHLYKTQVIELAKHLKIPPAIINKSPSADLWPGQTDAKELGFTYLEADPILYQIEQKQSPEEIIKQGYSADLFNQIRQVISKNSFKHQVPYTLK